jgi:SAM-dependent methyltransferase
MAHSLPSQRAMSISYELGHCPACGSDEAETIASADEIRAEVEALWNFHLARREQSVPVTELFDRAFFSQPAPLRIARCTGCGTLYRDPRESTRSLRETYERDEPEEHVLAELLAAQRSMYEAQARRLAAISGRAGNGLELGSYVGGFLAAARQAGWSFTGVDVSEAANDFARAQGFDVITGTLDDAPCGPYDAIVIWNCFDQLPDPRATLRAAHRRLRDNGLLALRVPNGACYARFRTHASARALLAWNNLLAFPYRQGFTPESLTQLVSAEGFKVVEVRGDGLARIADQWTKKWARIEERLVKNRLVSVGLAPWVEAYGERLAP